MWIENKNYHDREIIRRKVWFLKKVNLTEKKKERKPKKEKQSCLIRLCGHRRSVLLRSKIPVNPSGGVKVLQEMTTFSSKKC